MALIMFHAFTGCDNTSFFQNRGGKTAWKTSELYPDLPDPAEWGFTKHNSSMWQPFWTTEACKSCQELLKWGCDINRGCLGRCKCVQAGLVCTTYCKCKGDCER